MTENNLVCYELPKIKPVTRTKLHIELYGYKDTSNHGKYTYQRAGILSKVKGKKIIDAVLIVTQPNTHKIVSILQKYGAQTYIFNILTKNNR